MHPPPTQSASSPARFRHAPTPRDPSIPKTMRVAVEVGFVQSCPDCRAIVSNLSVACIGDASVTRFVAQPGSKHAHEVTEGTTALPGLSGAAPASDANGSEPEAVEAALFASDGLNGFDPQGRAQ